MELTDFIGRWRIARRIEDARAGASGLFEGVAQFVPDGPGLRYEEAGELRLGEGPGLRASRAYLWRPAVDGIEVFFEDGRDFHRLDPAAGVCTAFHDCPPDAYEVSYDFTRWPRWQATWEVTGLRKRYRMVSEYWR